MAGYDIPTGYDEHGKPYTYSGQGHLLLCGRPRVGKAVFILFEILCKTEHSMFVLDVKGGELAAVTARARALLGQTVFILNPYRVLPDVLCPSNPEFHDVRDRIVFDARYNPQEMLDPDSDIYRAQSDNLSDSVVLKEGGSHGGWGDTHWINSAQGLVSSLIGHVSANITDPSQKNLWTVRRAIASPRLLRQMAFEAQTSNGGQDESVAEELEGFIKKDVDNKSEIASIISTARTQSRFIGIRAIARSLSRSSFDFKLLREKGCTVFMILPVRFLNASSKWLGLVLVSALERLLAYSSGNPVLCILDEAAQLKKLPMIDDILGLGAGLNIQLLTVWQDLNQLKDIHGERAHNYPGTAGVQMYFAPSDYPTSEAISQLCGDKTIEVPSRSSGESRDVMGWKTGSQQGSAMNLGHRRAKLPQEIRQMPKNRFILFTDEKPGRYIEAFGKPYWETCEGLYSPNPYYQPRNKGAAQRK